jgi:hypothetical protein
MQHGDQQVNENDDDADDVVQLQPPQTAAAMTQPFFLALEIGDLPKITLLLNSGESINAPAPGGLTPVMMAIINKRLPVAKLLLERGADLHISTEYGSTLLHCAAFGGQVKDLEWVLSNTSIRVNSTNKNGSTPLMKAIEQQSFEAAKLLVERGGNLFISDDDGQRAVDYEPLGPQVLQHAKDLLWDSVKPLIILSKACSSVEEEEVLPFDPTTAIPSSLLKVFSISGLIRDYMAPYIMRKGLITCDRGEDEEPDDVKKRVEASFARCRAGK